MTSLKVTQAIVVIRTQAIIVTNQITPTGRDCDHKIILCICTRNQDRNGWSGLSGCWSTYLTQSSCNHSGNQNPSCFQKPL